MVLPVHCSVAVSAPEPKFNMQGGMLSDPAPSGSIPGT